MASKSTTPLTLRKQFYGSTGNLSANKTLETTKIPMRRHGSLRMRNSQSFSSNKHEHLLANDAIPNRESSAFLHVHRESETHFLVSTQDKMQKQSISNVNGEKINCTPNGHLKKHKINNNNVVKRDRSMTLNISGSKLEVTKSSTKTPHTPKSPGSAIRSFTIPQTPPGTPDYPHGYIEDDDLDSLRSYSSAASGMSFDYHSPVPCNGTTFSGRRLKYIVHCSQYAGAGTDYLTPTQRAQMHIRRLRELLAVARADLEQKDSEILKLTKEVVELRLFKATLSSPEERSHSSDAVTVKENTINDPCNSSNDVSPIVDMVDDSLTKQCPQPQLNNPIITSIQLIEKIGKSEMHSSFADSGHFEDLSSVHSKESYVHTRDQATGIDVSPIHEDRQALIEMYERKIEELIRQHDADKQDLQAIYNDKIEALLLKLSECNSRFANLMPDYDQAKEKIRELEKQLDNLQKKLQEQEDKANKLYLHIYTKGQESERVTIVKKVVPSRISIPELLQQLQVTQDELENLRDDSFKPEIAGASSLLSAKEAISLWLLGARKQMYNRMVEAQQNKNRLDPEVKLQFLKSAVYYFLTDKENSHGHLNAIGNILDFSDREMENITRLRATK